MKKRYLLIIFGLVSMGISFLKPLTWQHGLAFCLGFYIRDVFGIIKKYGGVK